MHSPGVAPEAAFEFDDSIASLKVHTPSSAAESALEFTTMVAAARPGLANKKTDSVIATILTAITPPVRYRPLLILVMLNSIANLER
jgi:hypothetical protein